MKNKILVELYIVETDDLYNISIPVNEYIGKIVKYIVSSAFELYDVEPSKSQYNLIDPESGEVYDNSILVRNSNIKNAKKVYLI